MVEQKRIQSVNRALDILEALTFGSLNLTELSKSVSLHKATTFQIISTLESRGYVVKDPKSKKYSLGLKIASVSEALLSENLLKAKSKPFLHDLSKITGETAHLAILEHLEMTIVDVELSTGTLIVSSQVGEKAVAHSSAVGKAMLAFLPEEYRERILSRKLEKYTENTITLKKSLYDQLEKIKQDFYAVDNEETFKNIICVACPVFDNHSVKGAIGISAPSIRMQGENIERFSRITREISQNNFRMQLGMMKKASQF